MQNHQKIIIFVTSSKGKEVLKLDDIEDKIKDLVESLRNYHKGYPRSKQLEQYIIALVYEILDGEE